jgi:DNA-binding transcriptional MerR regulator
VLEGSAERPLTIGEFARRSRLTPKALRIYDRIGLLRPASRNPATGYRCYRGDQIRIGQLIALLRGAGLSLAEISAVLADAAESAGGAVRRLDNFLSEIDRRHADRKLLIRHVQTTLKGGSDSMFPIHTRHVPALRMMSIQRRLHAHETDDFVKEAKAAFNKRLAGSKPAGPFMLIFHGEVSAESDGPLEAALGCDENVQPNATVGVRSEPEHDEAYTTVTKAQWAYPAILAAYDAVACSPEVVARPNSRLSCREVYLADPDDIGDDVLICDIAYPLGE